MTISIVAASNDSRLDPTQRKLQFYGWDNPNILRSALTPVAQLVLIA